MKELSHITEQREDRSTARPETKRIIPPSEARADTRKQWRTSRRLEQRRTYLSRSGLSQKNERGDVVSASPRSLFLFQHNGWRRSLSI